MNKKSNFIKNKKFIVSGVVITALAALVLIAALFNAGLLAGNNEISLIIVHTNDVHGRIWDEEETAMGYAHMAAKIKEIRDSNKNVLLLDSGDTFQGSSGASLSQGQSIVRIMNEMKYDAMVAGNHDFGYGWQRLCELSQMTSFPILSANVLGQDGKELLQPYVIKELSGIKIGIIGLTTPETIQKTHPLYVEGLTFNDPVEKANEIVEILRGKCDMIIALVHMSLTDAEDKDSCERLAREVDGIDLIVSGHSHATLENSMEVNNTYIVQTGEYGKNLGIVNVAFKKKVPAEIKASLYSPTWTEDGLQAEEDVQLLIDEIEKENEAILSQVIGWTDIHLDGERSRVRTGITNLGSLIAQAMVKATEADGAIMNGGGIRTSIEAGEITRRDVLNVLPFNNYVVLKEVKGSVILQALEYGVSAYPEQNGRFPQVAGIAFEFSPDKEPGSRIIEVTINGQELDPEKTYKIAVNDFIAAGGDGYTMLKDTPVLKEYGVLESMVAEYIKGNQYAQVN